MSIGTPPLDRLALLADDLTGACDAGVQFSARGLSSVVLLDQQIPESDEADLVIRSSNSRNDLPEVASEKVERSSKLFHKENRNLIFKKIDSTLRGNLGAEIQAVMTSWETSLAVLAPAFPSMGRTLEEGWLRGSGCAQAASVHLPTLLHQQGVANAVHFDQSVFRGGLQNLIRQFRNLRVNEPQVVVTDTAIQEHLCLIAQAAMNLEPRPLIVGSAGLAAEVASILARTQSKENPATPDIAKPTLEARPAVLFIGSGSPVTAAQVEYLLSNRPSIRVILRNCSTEAAQRAIESRLHLVVIINGTEDEGRTAEFTSRVCELACGGFILSGGDTAQLICRALNMRAIKLEREIIQGLPWGRILGGPAGGLPVATKAGGFGEIEALAKAADFLGVCGHLKNEDKLFKAPNHSD